MKVGKVLIEYDESKYLNEKIKYRLEHWEDFYEEKPSEDEVGEDVCDSDILDIYWNDVSYYLTREVLEKKNKDGYWKCIVEGFGRRNYSGEAYLEINNANDLATKVLPNTNCTFKVYNYGKGIAIQNWHHDSPTGNEWYYLTPIKESTYNKHRE